MSKTPTLTAVDVADFLADLVDGREAEEVEINGHRFTLTAGADSEDDQAVVIEFVSVKPDGPRSSIGFTANVRKVRERRG